MIDLNTTIGGKNACLKGIVVSALIFRPFGILCPVDAVQRSVAPL